MDGIYIVAIVFGIIAFGMKIMEYKKGTAPKQDNFKKQETEKKVTSTIDEFDTQPSLSRKCPSCGATIGVQDGFCKYCGSSQRIVTESNYTYSEHIERKIDEARIKEIEYKKEELKHSETWWQRLLTMILVPVCVFFLPFLLIMLMIKIF